MSRLNMDQCTMEAPFDCYVVRNPYTVSPPYFEINSNCLIVQTLRGKRAKIYKAG